MASSTGVPTLNRNFVHPLSVVAYSSRAIQRCIAQVLLLLDKKISLNDSINTSLEKIAKTLYDYWFVQFDFPDENKRPLISRILAFIIHPFRLETQHA